MAHRSLNKNIFWFLRTISMNESFASQKCLKVDQVSRQKGEILFYFCHKWSQLYSINWQEITRAIKFYRGDILLLNAICTGKPCFVKFWASLKYAAVARCAIEWDVIREIVMVPYFSGLTFNEKQYWFGIFFERKCFKKCIERE